jgi:hypothetical protein
MLVALLLLEGQYLLTLQLHLFKKRGCSERDG